MSNQEEKKMTKYDRKQEERRKQAEQEKKKQIRGVLTAAAIVLVIVAAVLYTVISTSMEKKAAMTETYITVGDHEITRAEYDYYYYYVVNEYLTMYSSFIPYMNLDTSKDFATQQYDETRTWKDAFDQMTVERIQQSKVLADAAASKNWTYDSAEDYENFLSQLAAAAKEYGVKESFYFQGIYGEYADVEYLKPVMEENWTASAYGDYLFEELRPTDEEIDAYYLEHKDSYDLIDYYEVSFQVTTTEEGSNAEEQEALAQEMAFRLEKGEEFEALCAEYFPETVTEETESTEEKADAHLKSEYTYSRMVEVYRDWMVEEGRTEGDVTLVEDADNGRYYVVQFVQRVYDEDCEETISDIMANDDMNAFLEEQLKSYEVTDVKGVLNYLTIVTDTEEETEATE